MKTTPIEWLRKARHARISFNHETELYEVSAVIDGKRRVIDTSGCPFLAMAVRDRVNSGKMADDAA
jgi:hypothetical protein